MRLPFLAAVYLLLLACSSADEPSDRIDEPPSTVDTSDTAVPVLPDDAWMDLEGRLVVDAAGTLVSGALDVTIVSRDPNTTALSPVCTASSTFTEPLEALPEQVSASTEPFERWEIPLSAGGCAGVPATMIVGIGPLPTALWPAVEQQGASIRHMRGCTRSTLGRPSCSAPRARRRCATVARPPCRCSLSPPGPTTWTAPTSSPSDRAVTSIALAPPSFRIGVGNTMAWLFWCATALAAGGGGGHSDHPTLGESLPMWSILPFAGLLLSIALLPMVAEHFWHKNRNQLLVAVGWASPVFIGLLYVWGTDYQHLGADAGHNLIHAGEEYISFIALLGSLYVNLRRHPPAR